MVRELHPCFNFRHRHLLLFHLLVVVIQLQSHDQRCCCVRAQQLYYSSAINNSKNWTVSWTTNITQLYGPGYEVYYYSRFFFIPILVHQSLLERTEDRPYAPSFALGFYGNYYYFYLAIVLALTDQQGRPVQNASEMHTVWFANRDRPVDISELIFTSHGELQLRDFKGNVAWSSNTEGMSVVGMELRESGNLVLFDSQNRTLWQSFDHPTDTLLPGQTLKAPQSLIANMSYLDSSYPDFLHYYLIIEKGTIHVSPMAEGGFGAFVGSDPPLLYYRFSEGKPLNFLDITGKTLTFVATSGSPASSFLRLESDGHMKFYEWSLATRGWSVIADAVQLDLGICGFPNVCGKFGLCNTSDSSCTCPLTDSNSYSPFTKPCNYFDYQIDTFFPSFPLKKKFLGSYTFPNFRLEKKFLGPREIYYPNYYMTDALLHPNATTEKTCKKACLDNSSCMAALFRYESSEKGSCYLPRELFSFISARIDYGSTANKSVAYVAVYKNSYLLEILYMIITFAPIARVGLGLLSGIAVAVYIGIRACCREEEEDIPQVPGMPTRFAYEYLRSATFNFARKLGTGGFGSVFSGILGDGTVVAVKLLQSVHQGKREFVAEVQTIGSIHHLNLVRLIGFCRDKSHRLLVYEYMSNGSLDNWIFRDPTEGESSQRITWETCRKIIRDVANGLHYLHEECRQRIAHLDIKPQNILLDSSFNAKISDFGMAKLIDRDMSSVNTIMRGTPGYLAPEWLTSTVTEKADIYSFGVVIVEIVCRRRNIDSSQPEEGMHLLGLLREKAMTGRLSEIPAATSPDDVQSHGAEMEKMLKLAMWCLQSDVSKRPSMSAVLMVLDGTKEIPDDLEYDFTSIYRFDRRVAVDSGNPTPFLDSELSGPR